MTPIAAAPPRPAVSPRVTAKVWLLAFLGANVALVTVFFVNGGLSDNPLISAGRLAGLVQLADTLEGLLRATVAFVLILVVGAASARFARKRIAYETWHFVHLYTYAAVLLAFTHQIAVGQSFTSHPVARAGQFFLWRFLTKDRWWQANPFSLSAAPDGRALRLTAKAVGESSANPRSLRVGTRVPYGAFTTIHQQRPNAPLVAGGVGITPIRALLEDITGHVVLLYRVRTPQDAVLLPELRGLAKARGATVHVLSGPSDQHGPHGPRLGTESLHALVPDVDDRDVVVCGPPGMTAAVLRSLRELRVPSARVHAERLSLAV